MGHAGRYVVLALAIAGCSGRESSAAALPDGRIPDATLPDVAPRDGAPDNAVAPDASDSDAADGAGFERLFNGMNLDGIAQVGLDATTLSVENGVLKCTGAPNGYWYPAGTYRNFILRLEYRFERPLDLPPGADSGYQGNSGYFVYVTPPHQVWPLALEVQGRHSDFGGVYELLPTFSPVALPDSADLEAAKRPLGEWNQLEIISNEGSVSVTLNGRHLVTSPPTALREGLLAFESEGAPIDWRNIEVKRLP